MRGTERERFDQRREPVRIVRQAEARRQVRRATSSRLVPGDDRELVAKRGRLRAPCAAVQGGAVGEDQWRTLAHAFIGDLEPVRADDLHMRNVQAMRYAER